MDDERELTIAIRHYPESDRHNVDDVDIGPLVSSLSETPSYLAYVGSGEFQEGEVEVRIRRTHEWEYEILLALAGGAGEAFASAVIDAVGARVDQWIADQSKEEGWDEPTRVRDEEGAAVDVGPEETEEARDELVNLLHRVSQQAGVVRILFPID